MPLGALPKATINLILAVVAVVVLIGISETGFQRSTAALTEISDAARTRSALNQTLQLVLDAETGSRGYLLTGDPAYLEPYNRAVTEIGQTLDTLRGVYVEDGQAQATLSQVAREVQRKLAEMDLLVRMRQQGNEDAWKFVLMSDIGKQHMDVIRSQVAALIATANERIAASQAQVRDSLLLARVGIAAVAVVALLAFYLYLRQSSALKAAGERQQQALQAERDLLERQVRERTASLTELATHLQQVREQERGHLARELHDELGALLTAAKLDVARLKSRLGTPAPEVTQRLQHLTETLNSGIALKRRIIEDLRPSSLTNLGLSASLEILAREFSEQSGVEVVTNLESVELDESRQITVYRLVQESLTNIAKYAEARHVEISVHSYTNVVEVTVRDDGKGFDVVRMRPSTHGLAGMRHRVESAGGRLKLTSSPGQGTRVVAVLPQGGAVQPAPVTMS
ncbi:CHASE3 domain-containing protein [Ramlibacter sp. AW1]|uniref:CHASE3 domain-containing protein n=1 Tax=Ramlibacter aurantiacus TaxID=2801330 RepID=A0A936ZPM5_9BURK|nr:CHASE3 domain-containing protein [Ramlibacter aurantiacus]MBL0420146.1 CHASE3 domain-containing protein [Ramlibacter aurantiacus]